MSMDFSLHIPFHPAEVEDLILTYLPAKVAPFFEEEAEGILFRFEGEIVAGTGAKDQWPWSDGDILGGPLSVPYSIFFYFLRGEYSTGIPQILRVTASILKARTEDLLLTRDTCGPILLRRGGVVTLTNRDCWTPAYFEALGISGPRQPLWAGDEGWEGPQGDVA